MNVKYAPVAQLDRVSDSDSEGGGFESHRADQTNTLYASRTGYLFGLYGDNRTRSA